MALFSVCLWEQLWPLFLPHSPVPTEESLRCPENQHRASGRASSSVPQHGQLVWRPTCIRIPSLALFLFFLSFTFSLLQTPPHHDHTVFLSVSNKKTFQDLLAASKPTTRQFSHLFFFGYGYVFIFKFFYCWHYYKCPPVLPLRPTCPAFTTVVCGSWAMHMCIYVLFMAVFLNAGMNRKKSGNLWH